ncbi:unnamed protein product [Paramecium primaurelia]|nr:unnamed protein product [Paramecium primaurelia]
MNTQNNKWEFKQIVTKSIMEFGTEICFIKENQFICVSENQDGQDYICFFELQNQQFQEQFNQQIKLIFNNQEYNEPLFPIMFNQTKRIILLRHKFNIYILSQQFHNTYRISTKLQFQHNIIQGSMTNDAQYMVLWEKSNSCYFIYKIKQNQYGQVQQN